MNCHCHACTCPCTRDRLAALEAEHAKALHRIEVLQRAVVAIAGMVTGSESPFGRIPIELFAAMDDIGIDIAEIDRERGGG